jgi:hypothetical protein
VTELAVVLPLLLAAVVALSIVVFVRTASAALRQARGASISGVKVAALAERLVGILDEAVRILDPAKDGSGRAPLDQAARSAVVERANALEGELQAIADAVGRLDAGQAGAPAAVRVSLLGAAAQAGRALAAAVEVAGSMAPAAETRPAESELRRAAERSLKRTWLDLVHARADAAAVAATSRDASQSTSDGSVGGDGSPGRGGSAR